ncbi:MAG: type II toxin-antitoxin system PemK/MazF family toxin [Gammaproteobacteria bacterium]|nr:MAG: type II toxin-antitoxin system PemK/MazF family toxin [Gammaproteobacteria bacterium]
MIYKKGDIVIVDFPFSNLTATKRRPALVLSKPHGQNIILSQISSKNKKPDKLKVFIDDTNTIGNLKFASCINVNMIFTIHNSLIYGKIARIDIYVENEIDIKLKKIFEIF